MRSLVLLLALIALHCWAIRDDKPAQVFILLGQSNMLGEGKISGDTNGTLEHAVHSEGRYPYLIDSAGAWITRQDVRHVFIMGSGNKSFAQSKLQHNEFMVPKGKTMGPEIGIGWAMGNYSQATTKAPTMILKACIGNRALGWDLKPPGSPHWVYTDSKGQVWEYAGYHESPDKWKQGETPKPVNWMAGEQYDGDVNRSKLILANFSQYYPGQTKYEVAGFFWWQGDRDRYDDGHTSHYEQNLVRLIKSLRTDFNAPNAKFVTASLGQTAMNATNNGGKILKAMLDVDGKSGKYPDFKGNVAAVYTHPLSMGGSSSGHYNGDARTYQNVGEAMGAAMVELLKGSL
jgi:hypothetical protein